MSRPLPGEPYFLFDFQITNAMSKINDNYKILLEVFPEYKISVNNIYGIDTLISHTGKSKVESWSHHALPTKYGGLAYRFLNKDFQDNLEWEVLFHEYEMNPPEKIIKSGDINTLSPIEKYEYLIGNTSFSMTRNEWQAGQSYMKQFGLIPGWIGLCHGSAPATLNSPRPIKAIQMKSFDGKHDIKFYPSDIKELLTYAWAKNGSASAMLGTRCGTVVSPGSRASANCLDPNPGAFHLAILNLLGLNCQPFIIDSSTGNEIWNRSVVSYRYKYFRPGTHNFTDKLEYALIPRTAYKDDPFSNYRSSETTSIVGVWIELTYIVGTKPSDKDVDTSVEDAYGKISYWYDLEINQEGTIIGGEWQDIHHPDFLWLVGDKVLPKSFYDFVIGRSLLSYDGEQALSPTIRDYAKLAAKRDELLFSILESMLKLSRSED
jgi:hypothetical protein